MLHYVPTCSISLLILVLNRIFGHKYKPEFGRMGEKEEIMNMDEKIESHASSLTSLEDDMAHMQVRGCDKERIVVSQIPQ